MTQAMIALTQEKREELIKDCEFDLKTLINLSTDFPENKSFQSALLRQKIALASLRADIFAHVDGSGLNFYRHPSATIEHALEQGDQVTALYTAPPVPEIKFPNRNEIPDWVMDDDGFCTWYEAETKRLNGWGE